MNDERKGSQSVTLGEELRQVRALHRLTLRQVEEVTGISNAYLSQLETGKIVQPSPNYLYKLAEVYRLPYDLLMEKAGYIVRSAQSGEGFSGTLAGATLASLPDMTDEEPNWICSHLPLRCCCRRITAKRGRKQLMITSSDLPPLPIRGWMRACTQRMTTESRHPGNSTLCGTTSKKGER